MAHTAGKFSDTFMHIPDDHVLVSGTGTIFHPTVVTLHIILILPLGETPEGLHHDGPHHCSAKGCNDKDRKLNKSDLKFKLFARKR